MRCFTVLSLLASTTALASEPSLTIISSGEVVWEQLNPARGDASPKAGTLWGDRNGSVATGFLVQFADGFSSPPHIHNVSYRGVVIRGQVHNADAAAPELWMPATSYWTQPKGVPHITAAQGSPVVAYIEIEEGPYLVRPVEQAFEVQEWPINVHAANLVWVGDGPAEVAYLWGDPSGSGLSGHLLRLPSGFSGRVVSDDAMKLVTIDGEIAVRAGGKKHKLAPGSYVATVDGAELSVRCASSAACVLYVRSNGEVGAR